MLPLRLGYVGVVNRNQKEIDSKLAIDDAIKNEKEWFENSPYKHIAHRMGNKYLQQTLNEQLGKHIKDKLPGIKTSIQKKTHQLKATLEDLGFSENNDVDRAKLLFALLDRLASNLVTQIEGGSIEVNVKTLKAGAKILRTIYGDIYKLIIESVSINSAF